MNLSIRQVSSFNNYENDLYKSILFHFIFKLAKSYKNGTLDPKDVIQKSFETANKNKSLNYFIRLCSEESQQSADKSSTRWKSKNPLGDLDGVPIAVKDNFCVKGFPATCASK